MYKSMHCYESNQAKTDTSMMILFITSFWFTDTKVMKLPCSENLNAIFLKY